MGSGTYSAAAASAAANPATPTDARGGGNGSGGGVDNDADTGFSGDGGIFSPGRRHRGRRDGGFFRGDHYCRVSVGRKGAGSGQVEVRVLYGGVYCFRGVRFWVQGCAVLSLSIDVNSKKS